MHLPAEMIDAVVARTGLSELPKLATVCRSIRRGALNTMRESMLSKITSENPTVDKETVCFMLKNLESRGTLVRSFSQSVDKVCGACDAGWRECFDLCLSCLKRQEFIPLTVATAGNSWLPRRELELRKLLHCLPPNAGGTYQRLMQPGWPKRTTFMVRREEALAVSEELFGRHDITASKRRKLYAIHERHHQLAKKAAQTTIVLAGPHVHTVSVFLQTVGTHDRPEFLRKVILEYFSFTWWIRSVDFYGNGLIPGEMHNTGNINDNHVAATRAALCRALRSRR